MRTLLKAETWNWYAAGDETIARRPIAKTLAANEPERVSLEMGLVLAIPLVLAVLAYALPG